jgi:hypothetical protein
LHNIGALTGGMVSQEIIKVVTEQYVPVDNTCVFDGIRSHQGVKREYPKKWMKGIVPWNMMGLVGRKGTAYISKCSTATVAVCAVDV